MRVAGNVKWSNSLFPGNPKTNKADRKELRQKQCAAKRAMEQQVQAALEKP